MTSLVLYSLTFCPSPYLLIETDCGGWIVDYGCWSFCFQTTTRMKRMRTNDDAAASSSSSCCGCHPHCPRSADPWCCLPWYNQAFTHTHLVSVNQVFWQDHGITIAVGVYLWTTFNQAAATNSLVITQWRQINTLLHTPLTLQHYIDLIDLVTINMSTAHIKQQKQVLFIRNICKLTMLTVVHGCQFTTTLFSAPRRVFHHILL